ncbi:aspartate racemase [Chryseobacterium ginsenosidimutans]|uniref:aspartate/glutamate racemase family protein n=1 Tax=Chryseobacterium ginsenosidimutans TaxID=687846 RepID=UPI0027807D59|nr:amino acid racemase [Chryseobacterium ginsenosidimutans]MDQ0595026.1 aspartate racemase [Chryseobacterium ginsenosidimutans]
MKKIGLVGGISWTSTLDYYKLINEYTNEKLGGLHSAEIIIYSIDFDVFENLLIAYDWEELEKYFSKIVQNLINAGAEIIMLGANTAHIIADKIIENFPQVEFIHIANATGEKIISQNIKKVGLLGTKYTMELDFYKNRLNDMGIHVVVPTSKKIRDYIDYTLGHELGKGIFKQETKEEYIRIINQLIEEENVEGIILGCTEIPLIISEEDLKVPSFNTTKIHSQIAVERAVK